ncbi:hypothetical protein BKH41_04200 [Helicobacter sp. 12S02232-10]|uniref:glycosyltransferase n=1 Tax=Helicobacter sp. 12S02232-10 TaxID=1476197 RepID=UPI000BD3CB7C|nr:glycosyltransferase [Helicobacter sp. 12S02232-10]PAF48836.1 hypothetical protein BKH41_04200 [Helicobacter sp. 12S02232-10]
MSSLAPVLITVYDRLDCLQNAIASLKTNNECNKTDLYIVSDYAYQEEHKKIISQIREYIKNIKGFQKVEGIFWDHNKGSFNSAQDAMKYLFSKYDKVIFFEDDILVSNRFLEYMNNALEFYKDDQRIISIASHRHHKIKIPKEYPYDVFLLKIYSPWGSAIWKDRYESIDWELKDVDSFLKDKEQIKAFNNISTHMLPILLDMLNKKKKYGDAIICYNMLKSKRYTLFPIEPLSVNRGHDGRGEHCVEDIELQNQVLAMDFYPSLTKNLPYDTTIGKMHHKVFYSFRRDFLEPFLKKIYLYRPLRFLKKQIEKIIFPRKKFWKSY